MKKKKAVRESGWKCESIRKRPLLTRGKTKEKQAKHPFHELQTEWGTAGPEMN